MAIKMSRYVEIISSVSGANAVAQQQLVGRRFTSNPLVPMDKIVSVTSATGAAEYFGTDSGEYRFASQYFSYISPAPASRADALQFVAWANEPRPARLFGYRISSTLPQFQAVTSGNLNIQIGGNKYGVTVDLSSATSLSNVANLVTSAIGSAAGSNPTATATYEPVNGAFTLTASTNEPVEIKVTQANSPDVGAMMGLEGDQAISSPGSIAQTPLQAFLAAEQISDSFGSASFADPVELDDAIAVAEYVSGENVKYQMYWSVDSTNAESWNAAMIGTASNALILNGTEGEYKEALPMAIMAATDYDRTNATINYMYRQPGTTWTADVTTDRMADYYDKLRVSYYGQTATAGQNLSFFQRGYLMGGATAPLDMSVHANEQWLKAYIKARLMSLFLTVNNIPANRDGEAMVLAIVNDGVMKAVNNGSILVGKDITELQKVAITRATNDDLAWHDIQAKGYWYNCEITQATGPSGVTEYTAKYTLIYAKGDAVRKVEGSHNLI